MSKGFVGLPVVRRRICLQQSGWSVPWIFGDSTLAEFDGLSFEQGRFICRVQILAKEDNGSTFFFVHVTLGVDP